MEFMRQRRMSGDIERRDADVGGGEDRRHVCVRHGSDECNAVERGGGIAYARQLRAVADEHGFDVVPAARSQPPYGVNQRDRAVPCAKSPGEHRNDVTFIARERNLTRSAGTKALRVGAPLGPKNLRRGHIGRDDLAARA